MRCSTVALLALATAWSMPPAAAQDCSLPDSVRAWIPARPPAVESYDPLRGSGPPHDSLALGIGHLHYADANPAVDLPPGAVDRLPLVQLPPSRAPGAAPEEWIANGWIVRHGSPPRPLPRDGLLETGYEEQSFIVLGRRADGWLRIRYPAREAVPDAAWVPDCALGAGAVRLDFEPWSEWFLSDLVSPLYFRWSVPEPLHAAPSADAPLLGTIAGEYHLEPLEVRGEWMRVVVKQPPDYCDPDVVSTRREGWVQWYAPGPGPRVWYYTRGC